jgi:hypothetical protein
LKTNFVSDKPSSWYAQLYKRDQLTGGHVIMLGADAESRCAASFVGSPMVTPSPPSITAVSATEQMLHSVSNVATGVPMISAAADTSQVAVEAVHAASVLLLLLKPSV